MNLRYCLECAQPQTQLTVTEYTCPQNHRYYNNPHAAVCIIFLRGSKILVSKRGIEPNKGMYDLPGGFFEYNEDTFDAAIREIKEETSVELLRENLELITAYTGEYLPNVSVVDLVVLAKEWTGTFTPDDDSEALEWKPFSFVDDPEFSPDYPGFRKLIESLADSMQN
ncbi:MAG: nucleotide pyrophosphohydrolase, partial [Candidatus Saccharibacteria bacterium]|nr:nucleotide pyrophosphohydrolase [Candidatus Saccharibacteria bacterium]